MAINYGKIRYLKTCASTKDLPDEKLPEIVLAGRSNVGKSSLVNALGGNKKLARVSQTPGKTQQIIYFDMDSQAILADLPGYGFSKASKDKSKGFSELCDNYFKVRKGIDLVLLLIDIRHDPSNEDIGMLNYLNSVGLPYFLVFTKCYFHARFRSSVRLAFPTALRGRSSTSALSRQSPRPPCPFSDRSR